MALSIRGVEYFTTMVLDRPGEAYALLSKIAASRVNLLAFDAVPVDASHTQLVLFPEDRDGLAQAAAEHGLVLLGPQRAFLIEGDDHLGALSDVHSQLFDSGINVYRSSGITDGRGGFRYLLYVKPADWSGAAAALGV
jgi:hypothetical protein